MQLKPSLLTVNCFRLRQQCSENCKLTAWRFLGWASSHYRKRVAGTSLDVSSDISVACKPLRWAGTCMDNQPPCCDSLITNTKTKFSKNLTSKLEVLHLFRCSTHTHQTHINIYNNHYNWLYLINTQYLHLFDHKIAPHLAPGLHHLAEKPAEKCHSLRCVKRARLAVHREGKANELRDIGWELLAIARWFSVKNDGVVGAYWWLLSYWWLLAVVSGWWSFMIRIQQIQLALISFGSSIVTSSLASIFQVLPSAVP